MYMGEPKAFMGLSFHQCELKKKMGGMSTVNLKKKIPQKCVLGNGMISVGSAVELANLFETHFDRPLFAFGDEPRHARDDRFVRWIPVIILNVVP